MGTCLEHITFTFINTKSPQTPYFNRCWKRWAPKHDEDPRNKILKSLDMGSIFSLKNEMGSW